MRQGLPPFLFCSQLDRDSSTPLVAFLLISVPIDVFFILSAFNTANFSTTIAFLLMILTSFVALIAFKVMGKHEEPLSFDKNPGLKGLGIGVLLGAVVLFVNVVAISVSSLSFLPSPNSILSGINYNSILFVPNYFATAQSSSANILNNAVFEVILTAPGEEGLKAAMLYGMYMLTQNELVSVVFSVGIWASFHVILVGFTGAEVLLAFISGLIWYGGWKYTGSLLTAIVSHGVYDASIAILAGL